MATIRSILGISYTLFAVVFGFAWCDRCSLRKVSILGSKKVLGFLSSKIWYRQNYVA